MELIQLKITDVSFDKTNGVFTYSTDAKVDLKQGQFGLIMPEENNVDRAILNPLYLSGPVQVKIIPLKPLIKKYEKGDVIGNLLLFSY